MTTAVSTPAPHRSVVRGRILTLLAVASVLAVTACTGSPTPSPTLEGGDGGTPPAVSTPQGVVTDGEGETDVAAEDEPAPDAEPSAEDPAEEGARAADGVESALQDLAANQPSVTSEQVRSAIEQGFAEAGLVPDDVEVSIDTTPTGLDVDAIQGAGRLGDTCVFGEVREGAVSVSVLSVLGSGYCFVGDQR